MMELSHSLILNEKAYAEIPESLQSTFIYEWLSFLDKVLGAAQKSDIKECQKTLVDQLLAQVSRFPGPPSRLLIGRSLATLFSVGDTFLLFETVNRCNDILKVKDDSPAHHATKLAAIACMGCMYERLGRMMGRSYEETVMILVKSLKHADSQTRTETMLTLSQLVRGMGTAASSHHREIFKAARHCLTDRILTVRCAAATCIASMTEHAPFLYTSDLETVIGLCFRALEGSTYETRRCVASLLGVVCACAITHQQRKDMVGAMASGNNNGSGGSSRKSPPTAEEVLGFLASGFFRGGMGGFLKASAGEMIKGTTNVPREVRIGIARAYVVLIEVLGSVWLERHLHLVLTHLLELVSNPRVTSTHTDAVCSRRCVSFILRSILCRLLCDKAQCAAAKDIVLIVLKQINADSAGEITAQGGSRIASSGSGAPVTSAGVNSDSNGQHLLVCALGELSAIVASLSTTCVTLVADPSVGLIETVFSGLTHSSAATRANCAWCIRCIAVALPSQMTPLLERCIDQLELMRNNPAALSGYSGAIVALLGAATRYTPLGIPHTKGKIVFNLAEELLRSASQSTRLALQRAQSGWLLVGGLMTLGPAVIKKLLPRVMLLWKSSFPRSQKDLESEKSRGDAFTWQVTLESRAGALAAMSSFLRHCGELVDEEVRRRVLGPVESALFMLSGVNTTLKSYGQHLKASAAMVRLRLYETMSLLPPVTYESNFNTLLRLLVAEFTLTEHQMNTATSRIRALCRADEGVALSVPCYNTFDSTIEDQGEWIPSPLPLGVAVIDASIVLYGLTFPHVAVKHRLQMMDHFSECVKHTKAHRQEALLLNVFAALLSALKALADQKVPLGGNEVRQSATNFILGSLSHANPVLRMAAAEALGKVAQVTLQEEARFVGDMAQYCFDRLNQSRDAVSRTGHSMALGCLHRSVGGLGNKQHLNTSISVLLALAEDTNAPVVQVWALQALSQIADTGGPAYRPFVEATLSLAIKLLLTMPSTNHEVHRCLGGCLAAAITTLGPELQGNTNAISSARSSLLVACHIMQNHREPLVQAEAVACLQQLHMFAPKHLHLNTLVPTLCQGLSVPHLQLRRAIVSCFRQLAQREAGDLCRHVRQWTQDSQRYLGQIPRDKRIPLLPWEKGLATVLFTLLDLEDDPSLTQGIHDTLTGLLQQLLETELTYWLTLCKDVLTDASSSPTDSSGGNTTGNILTSGVSASPRRSPAANQRVAKGSETAKSGNGDSTSGAGRIRDDGDGDSDDTDDDDDGCGDAAERMKAAAEPETHPSVGPRWRTKVFAAQCLYRIVTQCSADGGHFDLTLARKLKAANGTSDFLVLHLSDLVRMAFMAATSDSDLLRLEGLKVLQAVIDRFSRVPEPEFPGHVILEQYQAQVGAALRPAFAPETPSHVTAAACRVCSAWIACGVARDLNDLRRVHQLLVSSLQKLQRGANSALYNESAATLEKLSILRAWAEVYIVAMRSTSTSLSDDTASEKQSDETGRDILKLVTPQLRLLSRYWLAALKDYALLSLPVEYSAQLPHHGGAFYTPDTIEFARPHYRESWSSTMQAAVLWLCAGNGFETLANSSTSTATTAESASSSSLCDDDTTGNEGAEVIPEIPTSHVFFMPNSERKTPKEVNCDWFNLLFGICVEALCNPRAAESHHPACLVALDTLLKHPLPLGQVCDDRLLAIELCGVLQRTQLTRRDSVSCQRLVVSIATSLVRAWRERYERERTAKRDDATTDQIEGSDPNEIDGSIGEIDIQRGVSIVYGTLEMTLCVLSRYFPQISPQLATALMVSKAQGDTNNRLKGASNEDILLICDTLKLMAELPKLCSNEGLIKVLPTLLYVCMSVFAEMASIGVSDTTTTPVLCRPHVSACLQCLKALVTSVNAVSAKYFPQAVSLLQSALDKLLDLCKMGDTRLDDACVVFAVALFILSAPKEVVAAPNLQYPCINHMKLALEKDVEVKISCVTTLRSIFAIQSDGRAIPYIQGLGPRVAQLLVETSMTSSTTPPEAALRLAVECMNVLDTLLNVAPPDGKSDFLSVYVPVLVSVLLIDDCNGDEKVTNDEALSQQRHALHEQALQRLNMVGATYTTEFRAIMTSHPRLRKRLEMALHAQRLANQRREIKLAQQTALSNADALAEPKQPMIKLTMDFSKFKAV